MHSPQKIIARFFLGLALTSICSWELFFALVAASPKVLQGDLSVFAQEWNWIVLCIIGVTSWVLAAVSWRQHQIAAGIREQDKS